MPNRIIKESICDSMSLSECSMFAQDLYKRLITYADDYGRFNSDTEIMRARLYAREYTSVSEQDIIDALVELAGVSKIQFYTAQIFNQGGKSGIYGVFPNWDSHQRQRETKAKTPEPYDTDINDWYLRRFVPLDMKAEILERDGFKCQICGKFLTSCRDAKRFVKLGTGLFHIDHVVPVLQGGRATFENLRLTCPECNLRRKRTFTFRELLRETCGELRQSAASCGELRPESESESKSESKSESNASKRAKRFSPPTIDDVKNYCSEHGYAVDPQRFVDYYTANGWKVGKNPMKDWQATVRSWANRDREAVSRPSSPANPALNYEQRSSEETAYNRLFVNLDDYAKE